MLLVHDGETEPPELDRLLHQGMGADDAADLAARDRRAAGRTLFRFQPRRQQGHLDAERLQQPAERREVLLGENLRRRHDRRLVARLHRRAHGERGDHGLARADVALQQAMHRIRRRHVAADVVPHALLRRRQRKRQARPQPREELAARAHRHPPLPRRARAEDREAELKEQEVVEGQAPERGDALGFARGKVSAAQGIGQRRQMAARTHSVGQRLVHLVRVRLDETPEQRAQRLLRQPLGGRVHGHERAGVDRLVVARVDRLPFLNVQADLVLVARAAAVHDQPLPALHGAGDPRPPEDGGGAIAALVTKHDGQRLSVATGRRRTEADHHAGTRRDLARAERAQRCEARAVLVAQWQVEERVADGGEAFLRQLGGTLRPHALHVLQRRAEADGRARLPRLGHRVIKPAGSEPFAIRPRRSVMQFEE